MTKYRLAAFKKDLPQPLRNPNICQQQDQKTTQLNRPILNAAKNFKKHAYGQSSVSIPSKESSKLSLKKVFLVMSRMHHMFKLKYQTLFLALQIYLKYHEQVQNVPEENPEQQSISESCLILVSMYLAMKYQEIYPPRLKNLYPFIKVDINKQLYTIFETKVLLKLSANLNIRTASNRVEELFKETSPESHFQAYYFTEIAYSNSQIIQQFSSDTIIISIFYIMSPLADNTNSKVFKGCVRSEVIRCSKLLIQSRNTHLENDSTLNRKYSHERYLKVAEKPWISLRRES